MTVAVMILGAVAEAAAWVLVATRRVSVWRSMPWVLGGMGIVAAFVRPPVAAERVGTFAAFGVGLVSGLAFYVATRIFVSVAARWRPFGSAVASIYGEAAEVSLATSLFLSLLVMIPAEELFWRALFQARLDASLAAPSAAIWTWLAYVGVNLASRRAPIVAGAVVGGALWAALAAWSGGMLASLGSHMLWTGLMLALPPGAGRKGPEA